MRVNVNMFVRTTVDRTVNGYSTRVKSKVTVYFGYRRLLPVSRDLQTVTRKDYSPHPVQGKSHVERHL